VGPGDMISCYRDTRYILPVCVWVEIAKYSNEIEHRSYPFPAPGKWGSKSFLGRAPLKVDLYVQMP